MVIFHTYCNISKFRIFLDYFKKRFTTISSIRKRKSLIRYGDFVETTLSNEDLYSLRNICRMRNYLIQSAGDLKRKVICVLDQVFPEHTQPI